jgi:hypothetical protein
MPNPISFAAAAVAVAGLSLAGATSAEAHRHRHHHRGVSIVIGAPLLYGGYYHRHHGYYPSYYRGYGPECLRWAKTYSRSGRVKWRCVVW